MNKKFLFVAFAVVAFCYALFNFYPKKDLKNKEITIGIIQTIEHPALDQTRKGFIEALKKKKFKIIYESAQGNTALSAQIAQKFVGNNVDVILSIGTMPTQTAAQVTQSSKEKMISVVFASVTDPQSTKIVENLKYPEKNVTGVSNYIDVKDQLSFIKNLMPKLTRLGIIYNTGESNSVVLVEKMKVEAKKLGIHLELSTLLKASDVTTSVLRLVSKVDAIFINNDNTSLSSFGGIAKTAKEQDIPVFVSDIDLCEEGAVGAFGADQYRIGEQAASLVLKIVEKKAIKDIPVEFPDKTKKCFNDERLKHFALKKPKT